MKITRFIQAVLWIGLLTATRVAAGTYYVATNGTGNGTTWALATSNIQAAVDASTAGDIILVSNGTYYCWSNSPIAYAAMVTVTKAVTVQSVNGPEVTIVDANYPAFTNRGFYITDGGTVSGFTITNGRPRNSSSYHGGGALIIQNGKVTNCWITGNWVSYYEGAQGGGVACERGGEVVNCRIYANVSQQYFGAGVYAVSNGLVRDCVISNNADNITSRYAYAVMLRYGGVISNCTVINNQVSGVQMGQAGVTYAGACTVDNCRISGNITSQSGGGLNIIGTNGLVRNSQIYNNYAAASGGGISMSGGTVSDCVISSNRAYSPGGVILNGNDALMQNCIIVSNIAPGEKCGGIELRAGTLRNCLIASNSAYNYGGGIRINIDSATKTARVENCTVVNNYLASGGGAGIYCEATAGTGVVINTIVYSNYNGTSESNWLTNNTVTFTNCCTTPTNGLPGSGNITNNPAFIDYPNKNYRLLLTSPCINAGIRQDWMNGATELDRHRRLDKFSGRPDIGCYEYLPPGTMCIVK